MTATKKEVTVVNAIKMNEMDVFIVGETPFVPHAMSAKAAGMILFPPGRKNAAEKATSMKHEPWEEFRDAAYKFRDTDEAPTRLFIPGTMFHAAMAAVSVDLVNVKKAQVARLTSVPQMKIPVWGVPQIWCTIVRSSDMNRTPDVRTLPILPRWACKFTVRYTEALIKDESIVNLLVNAGILCGIGDGRPQRGKLNMGTFRLVSEDDDEYRSIVTEGERAAQDAALQNPVAYDIETEQLLAWFQEERGRRTAAPPRTVRRVA